MIVNKILYILIIVILASCSLSKKAIVEEPKHNKQEVYIKHYAYSLVFNDKNKQADWVAYKLNSYQTESSYKRTNKFIVDTLIPNGTATNADYYKSGYDKGHLAPAADMAWNKQAMRESFYFSNISPQLAGFNRGIWKKLEVKVRSWAALYDSIYICTGPVFINPINHLKSNSNMKIPTHFYKTILVYNDTVKQAIGFVFPHVKSKLNVLDYAVTIDSVERLINKDLYYNLPNRHEKKIEKAYDLLYW